MSLCCAWRSAASRAAPTLTWFVPQQTTGTFTFGNGMGAADPNPMQNPLLNWFEW